MKAFLTILILGILVVGGIYLFTGSVPFFPKSESKPEETTAPTDEQKDAAVALLRQGDVAAGRRATDEAVRCFEEAVEKYPETWGAREASLQLGNIYYVRKEYPKALDAFKRCLPNLDEPKRADELIATKRTIAELEKRLGGGEVGPVGPTHPVLGKHTVRAGENFTTIARKYGITVEQVKLANRRTSDFVREGEELVISGKMPAIRVSKMKLTLQLVYDGSVLREPPVGIGAGDLTPAGTFKVVEKLKKPAWHRPGHAPIPYGDPENILGTRWMTLVGADGVRRGYGIHGTTVPASVPGRRSAGCIRMLNKDVEELFEWTPPGTTVTITED